MRLPNFWITFFLKSVNKFVDLEILKSRLAQRSIWNYTSFIKLGDWLIINPFPPPCFTIKQGKEMHRCSVPKSCASRLTLLSHCVLVSRRIHILAVYIFFAISSVCPLLVSYQTTANLFLLGPLFMYFYSGDGVTRTPNLLNISQLR